MYSLSFPHKQDPFDPHIQLPPQIQTRSDIELAELEEIFKGLPRTKNPFTGNDDTETIWRRVVAARPEVPYYPDQTSPRRKLYMAICELRKTASWRGDSSLGVLTPAVVQ